MSDWFLPYFFIALVSDPLITRSEYFFTFRSLEEKQSDPVTKEISEITAGVRCRVVRPEATRCTIDDLAIFTRMNNSLKRTRLGCGEVKFCKPFEIIFNSTGVESLLMSDELKNSRISTVSDIANLINIQWIEAISKKQDVIQESTINGECTSRIVFKQLNESRLMGRLFPPEITLKYNSSMNILNIYHKLRDVKSCSRGRITVSENIFSSLENFEHRTIISPDFVDFRIKKKTIFNTDRGKINIDHLVHLNLQKVQLITDTELPEITNPVSVPFLSL
ncbi:hypothetical protein KQX54_001992 [Cotesia glomerata]|uniref:Uncharacterized protein n=1 Tax=Cotesia glomerata TaxID=32391 RepID=A0AAV7I6G5_COTGL|nr:hypothetical protein KQX54_001992 [Cotesia glomerata]